MSRCPAVFVVVPLLLFAVSPPALAAGSAARPLLDIHPGPAPAQGSNPIPMAGLADGRAVLAAADARHGREPWVTDGTAAGTFRLADLVPGPDGSLFDLPFAATAGARVVFVARGAESSSDQGLWSTDGTRDGTLRLVHGLAGVDHAVSLAQAGDGRAFLLARDVDGRPGLWVTDGTPAGTRRLPHPGLRDALPGEIVGHLGSRALYIAGTGVGGAQELWSSDGTPAGTRRLLPGTGPGPAYLGTPVDLHVAVLGGGAAVVVQELGPGNGSGTAATAVWRTDGTPEGTRRTLVLEERLSPGSVVGGPRAAFVTTPYLGPSHLWISDGTAAGTRRVAEHALGVWPERWVGETFFHAVATESGDELWAVDAEAAGARRLALLPGAGTRGSAPLRGGLALVVRAGVRDEMWWSDGTPPGTGPVAPIPGDLGSGELVGPLRPGTADEVLLLSTDTDEGWDLHAVDGPAAGLRLVAAFVAAQPRISRYRPQLEVGDGLLFPGDDGVHGGELWLTDGTAPGTRMVDDLALPEAGADSWPQGLLRHDGELWFTARDADGWGLWRTDGTAGATVLEHRLPFQPEPHYDPYYEGPRPLIFVGEQLFLIVPTAEPWRVDLKVADLGAGQLRHLGRFETLGEDPVPAAALGDELLWAPMPGQRLVVSDGTVHGTRTLPLRSEGGPARIAALGDGTALVKAHQVAPIGPTVNHGLWRTDGTLAGSRLILAEEGACHAGDLTPASGGVVYFSCGGAATPEGLAGLWRTDGTPSGTVAVRPFDERQVLGLTDAPRGLFFTLGGPGGVELWLLPRDGGDARPLLGRTTEGQALRFIDWTAAFGDGVLFSAFDDLHGLEPWVSDGTVEGTARLGDLERGAGGSLPQRPAVAAGQAFFAAAGRLWRTDGTPGGTFAVFGDGEGSVATGGMESVGGWLVFAARTLELGREPWVLDLGSVEPLPPPPPPTLPAAPTGLVARSSAERVFLDWRAPAGDLRFFDVEVRTPADPAFRRLRRQPVQMPFEHSTFVDGLPADVPHTFRVRAVNDAGASAPSGEATASALSAPVSACQPSDEHLCLLGDRLSITAWWRDPRTGDHGRGHAVPFDDTDLSGTFWFFRDGNVELIVKALDGTPVNRRWWVFAGGLTDLEYWLRAVDSESAEADAVRWYHHPARDLCGFADTAAFAGPPAFHYPLPAVAAATADPPPAELDLLAGRYRVTVEWRDPRSGDTGVGRAVPGSDNTGYFWFFRPGNVELVVKVLDGTPVNGHRWVFYGGLTDVEYTLHVVDLVAGTERRYRHAPGDLCGGADTTAF